MSRFYHYDEFYDILSVNGSQQVFFREMPKNLADDQAFTFFFVADAEAEYADNDIHLEKLTVLVHVYNQNSLDSYQMESMQEYVSHLRKNFKILPEFTNDVPQLQDYQCYIFEIEIMSDIVEWL